VFGDRALVELTSLISLARVFVNASGVLPARVEPNAGAFADAPSGVIAGVIAITGAFADSRIAAIAGA
jgi:hypothetical protein